MDSKLLRNFKLFLQDNYGVSISHRMIDEFLMQSEQLVCECGNQTIELNNKNNHYCTNCGELIFKAN